MSLTLGFNFQHNGEVERQQLTSNSGVAELWDDFTQSGTNFQWFQPPNHPACNAQIQYEILESTAPTHC